MWMHRTQRVLPRPAAAVRRDIGLLVDRMWGRVVPVTTTEHHGRRSDWIPSLAAPDELDVVLTWTLVDLDGATFLTLELDEIERGPDPGAELEAILDVVAAVDVVG
jgi:hypothetical protein